MLVCEQTGIYKSLPLEWCSFQLDQVSITYLRGITENSQPVSIVCIQILFPCFTQVFCWVIWQVTGKRHRILIETEMWFLNEEQQEKADPKSYSQLSWGQSASSPCQLRAPLALKTEWKPYVKICRFKDISGNPKRETEYFHWKCHNKI